MGKDVVTDWSMAEQYAHDLAAMLSRDGMYDGDAHEVDRGSWVVAWQGIAVRIHPDGTASVWTRGANIDHLASMLPAVQDWYQMRAELMAEVSEIPR